MAESSRRSGLIDMADNLKSREDAVDAITAAFLTRPTAKQQLLTTLMKSTDNRYPEFCLYLTRKECHEASVTSPEALCSLLHFKPVLYPQTDPSYGHCSYLNTCHRTTTCKYLHFELDTDASASHFDWKVAGQHKYAPNSDEARDMGLLRPSRALVEANLTQWVRPEGVNEQGLIQPEPQWIDCDLKNFDYSMLGKFDVILADPPWDIHMSLPYGTMSDDDMRAMPVPLLQDEGLLFLWTTGRAMELGRELLAHWGYTRIDELIWVKVGQTQRLIRTGRTGHHLNHTKEHCLVGAKIARAPGAEGGHQPRSEPIAGSSQQYVCSQAAGVPPPLPHWVHSGTNADVIVSEVRDTSRKPDELYGIIERLCPSGRKVELFGRKHNVRRGWLTLGNQLKGDNVLDPSLRSRLDEFRRRSQHSSYSRLSGVS
ncbi:MT-A70-domain-containing protein [Testicularia cyperi]|uniref:mRNA m(6)A methyltransferase n=1 Tax=Testicularia cyperi TaxID=1882483 RepID=A0A317XMS7_9BASI|nr:MT-A70-domain-containing protein [Testicularia cyperi]